MNDSQLDLVRRELRLRREIAIHELQCLLDDDPGNRDAVEKKLEDIDLIDARRAALERCLRENTVA